MTPRHLPVLLAASALLAVSCGGNPESPGSAPATDHQYTASLEFLSTSVRSLWATPSNDVFGLTYESLLHYEGGKWQVADFQPPTTRIEEGWGLASGGYYLSDHFNLYIPRDGIWDRVSIPGQGDICVTPNGEVFDIGADSWSPPDTITVYHFNGSFWATPDTVCVPTYVALTASDPNDAFIVGVHGDIAHFDGKRWRTRGFPELDNVDAAWKAAGGPLYVTTNSGPFTVLDSVVTPLTPPAGVRVYWFFGSGADNVYAYGADTNDDRYKVYRVQGGAWTPLASSVYYAYTTCATSDGNAFFSTGNGITHAGSDGSDSTDAYDNTYFYNLWESPEGHVFACGDRVFRHDGDRWIDLDKESLTTNRVGFLCGRGDRDLYAFGNDMILHYDGTSWDWVSSGFQLSLHDGVTTAHDVLAVGSGGAVVRYDGREWGRMDSGTTKSLNAIVGWDDGAMAGGVQGTIIRFDGARWTPVPSPMLWTIYHMIAFDPLHIVAVGDDPREIGVYNGNQWTVVPIDGPILSSKNSNVGVWGTSMRDFFVARYYGDVLHFDGSRWTRLPRAFASNVVGIAGDPGGDVFVTTYQTMVRYHRQ